MTNMPTNEDRANRCGEALHRYGTDDTDRSCLIDFLTDARHWCDRHGEAFAKLDRIAYEHYVAEIYEQARR